MLPMVVVWWRGNPPRTSRHEHQRQWQIVGMSSQMAGAGFEKRNLKVRESSHK